MKMLALINAGFPIWPPCWGFAYIHLQRRNGEHERVLRGRRLHPIGRPGEAALRLSLGTLTKSLSLSHYFVAYSRMYQIKRQARPNPQNRHERNGAAKRSVEHLAEGPQRPRRPATA
ncbi:hypothetical protein SBA6_950007 [Candidatus Sulfopaludibacter sp. SbA6]|nr:hypothetical protein SBA6_950007 [Candidatus Sulfopaludibacter sp. SbA6]